MSIYSAITPFLDIIYAAIIVAAVIVLTRITSYITNHLKKFKKNLTLLFAIKDMINFLIWISAIIFIFKIFGIDLKGILLSIGIVGIALSFAAKDFLADFMSGLFIITYKTLEVGDVMQINTWKGEVTKIGLRNTILVTEIGDTIIIPNSILSTTVYSRFKPNELEKIKIKVVLPPKIDMEQFSKEIIEIINSYDEISKTRQPSVESKGYGEYGPILEVIFWVKTFNKKEEYNFIITNQIRKLINEKLGDDN